MLARVFVAYIFASIHEWLTTEHGISSPSLGYKQLGSACTCLFFFRKFAGVKYRRCAWPPDVATPSVPCSASCLPAGLHSHRHLCRQRGHGQGSSHGTAVSWWSRRCSSHSGCRWCCVSSACSARPLPHCLGEGGGSGHNSKILCSRSAVAGSVGVTVCTVLLNRNNTLLGWW